MRKIVFIIMMGFLVSGCANMKKNTQTEAATSKPGEMPPFDETLFMAMTQKSLGNLDKAYGFFQQCIELDNTQALPYYELARLDVKNNNIDLAISNAKMAQEKDPTNEWYCTVLADAYQKKANYKNAIVFYKKAIDLSPNNQSYYSKVIKNYKLMNDANGALNFMEVKEQKFGVSEELSFDKYDTYLSLGKPQKAEAELLKLIDYFPNEVRYRGMLAEFYGSQGEIEKALNQYEIMRKMDPENGSLHWQLAHHYLNIGQKNKAFDEFVVAFRSSDISEDNKIEVVQGYLGKNQSSQAKTLIEILQEIYPNSNRISELLGDVALDNQEYENALTHYRKTLENNHSDQDLWMRTLKLEYSLGEGKLLSQDGTKATELFPVQPVCYLYKALGKIMIGEYKEAKTALFIGKEYVLDDDLLMGLFLERLGTVSHELNDDQKANEFFQKALTKAPNDNQVQGSYFFYLLDKGKLDEVQTSLNALTINESNLILKHVKAQLYAKQNKLQESLNLFKQLETTQRGTNPLFLEHYGDLLLQLGNKNQAIKIWQKALDKTGNPRLQTKIQNS